MSTARYFSRTLLITGLAIVVGCEEEAPPKAEKPPPAKTAAAMAPRPAPTAAPEPKHDCPEGSSGEGSFGKPCEAKGPVRMMEVTYTGKMTDTGPSFRVINKSKLVILYGRIVAYFYDKAGKQLEVPSATATDKPKHHQACGGNIFSGVMNPDEKAVITFSCINKSHVPEGTAAVEAEMQMVGFADAEGKKNDFYWKNDEIAPDERPKGGLKDTSKDTTKKKKK